MKYAAVSLCLFLVMGATSYSADASPLFWRSIVVWGAKTAPKVAKPLRNMSLKRTGVVAATVGGAAYMYSNDKLGRSIISETRAASVPEPKPHLYSNHFEYGDRDLMW